MKQKKITDIKAPAANVNTTTPVIHVDNVSVLLKTPFFMKTKHPVKHLALNDLSFSVDKGQVFGIIGRNGSGKSTLLRVLARIITPDSGIIKTYGKKAQLLTLNVGFEHYLTGRDNSVLMAMFQGMSHKEALSIQEEVKEFSELDKWFDQPIATYSSGMKARLGFATAIKTTAELILLDEVLSVGDVSFKKKAADAMKGLIKSNRTVVLVSNNPNTISNYADQAMWLSNGEAKLISDAKTIAEIYTKDSS